MEPIIFVLTKIIDSETNIIYIQFSAVNTVWTQDIGRHIQQKFSLTNSELDIAKRLVSGEKISEIAEVLNKSIWTVKPRCKSLFSKTSLRSQSELIKVFSTLQRMKFEHDFVNNQKTKASQKKPIQTMKIERCF